jgi:hypothetical protein
MCLIFSPTINAVEYDKSVQFGVSQPFLIKPGQEISDTYIFAGYSLEVANSSFFDFSLFKAFQGREAFRSEIAYGYRLNANKLSPYLKGGIINEWSPDFNFGLTLRVGADIDLSRLLRLHFLFLRFETGLNFLFMEPSRNEFDIARVSLGYGF